MIDLVLERLQQPLAANEALREADAVGEARYQHGQEGSKERGRRNCNNCEEARTFSVHTSRCRVNSRLVTI